MLLYAIHCLGDTDEFLGDSWIWVHDRDWKGAASRLPQTHAWSVSMLADSFTIHPDPRVFLPWHGGRPATAIATASSRSGPVLQVEVGTPSPKSARQTSGFCSSKCLGASSSVRNDDDLALSHFTPHLFPPTAASPAVTGRQPDLLTD